MGYPKKKKVFIPEMQSISREAIANQPEKPVNKEEFLKMLRPKGKGKKTSRLDQFIFLEAPDGGLAAGIYIAFNKKQEHIIAEPNPVHIYYNAAVQQYNNLEFIQKEINACGLEVEQVQRATGLFVHFFAQASACLMLLQATIEAFVNQIIPENQTYSKFIRGQQVELNRDGILKDLSLMIKIKEVLPKCEKTYGKYLIKDFQKVYDWLDQLQALRNEVVHLKAFKAGNFTYYANLYNKIIQAPYNRYFEGVFTAINYYKPGFIKEESTKI